MNMFMLAEIIAKELGLSVKQVQNTVELLMDGATVPFIARYRKEATGSLDEVAIGNIKELHEKYTELQRRKETVIATIEEQGKLTEELKQRIVDCYDPVELEDIYLPYRPKRRTRATIARERGLEPLAEIIFAQHERNIGSIAEDYINDEVTCAEDAISGACDIIAERVAEDEYARNAVRRSFGRYGVIKSKVIKGKEADGIKFSDYYEASAPVARVSSHRLLAMMRGEEEGYLRLSISIEPEYILEQLSRHFIKRNSVTREYMTAAIEDGYKRLLEPSIENETKI